MKLTNAEHGEYIFGRLQAGASYRAIARELGCVQDTVSKFARKQWPGFEAPTTAAPEPPPAEPSAEELLRAELAKVRAESRKARTTDVQAELLLQAVREQTVPADVKYEAPECAEGVGKTHVQMLLLSDLHIGEVVSLEAVNGLNEYNWDIFVQRMGAVRDGLVSFQNARPYPIDELVIALLGDNVSNNHHKELSVTNEFPITEQCIRGGVFLGQWIESLVPDYPRIRVVGVGGNHGRVDPKPSSKQVFDSFDWLGYQYISLYLSKYPTIETHFPRSGQLVIDVAGRNVLVWHGDGVKSTMPGVPWGGVIRRVNELKNTYGTQDTHIHYTVCGHFHQGNAVRGGTILVNGSLMGLNEHGLKDYGSGDEPMQLLLTFCRDTKKLTDVSFITP